MTPHLPPGALEACPVACQPRPRDLATYRAACEAAEGDQVHELDAIAIAPGMVCWHLGRWLPVSHVIRDGDGVELHFDSALRLTSPTTPVYCRATGSTDTL